MKKRLNNKGFSLVELIVVMAIMAILAVTLAPRLTHYVDKARQASDEDAANTIYNTTRLTLADDNLFSAFTTNATKIATTSSDATTAFYLVSLESIYNVSTANKWTVNSTNASANTFYSEVSDDVGVELMVSIRQFFSTLKISHIFLQKHD
ncbi:MAG: type II secretion system protein [Herbinix sp.]|nr:type II secretion system protein [Herbinix sp.]